MTQFDITDDSKLTEKEDPNDQEFEEDLTFEEAAAEFCR